ncbi:MAG TPA: PAS domain S-box protein [Bryobacteraceae bacterium]|nr:PAS domain S-box protein [Bryobacteraceae bacterium]
MTDRYDPIQSPTLLREIVESAPVAMVMIDRAGLIVLVNAEAEALFDYNRSELLGQSVEILIPPRYRGLHPAYRSAFYVEPQSRLMGAGRELFGLRKDGGEFPIEIGLKPIGTEEGLFVLSAIVNLTQRKLLEARFRATVESAPMAMVMTDRRGFIVLVNSETEKLFGYARAELLESPIEVLVPDRYRAKHPETREGFLLRPEARRMGAGRDLFAVRKDGSEFPVEIGLNPVETDEGMFVLSAIVDITERKRNARQLEIALTEKTILLNEIHHRVKNNLQIISGLLQLQAGQTKDPALRELLVQSQSRVQSMSLIHELLYEGRDFSSIRLDRYLARLGNLLWGGYMGGTNDVTFVADLEEVSLDLNRAIPCGLLVNELLTNSLKHGFPGARKGSVTLTVQRTHFGKRVRVCVEDDGVGLPAGLRLQTSPTLGLTLARELASQLGAELEIVPREAGACFALAFPLEIEEGE